MVFLNSSVFKLIFCLVVLSVVDTGVAVFCYSNGFVHFRFCFMHFASLLFTAYTFKIAMTSWYISPFFIICIPIVSAKLYFLKSTLFDII